MLRYGRPEPFGTRKHGEFPRPACMVYASVIKELPRLK
jgi:hypothetical protein